MTEKREVQMWQRSLEHLKALREPGPTVKEEQPPAYPCVNDWGEIPVPRPDSEIELGKIKDPAARVRARQRMIDAGTYHRSEK